ncbi:hypothetical protein [Cohnella hongkongensis]|uniref:Lipoprotein n=1 Tax=Cohnella hongkongensis TaxID=178337 RepID=A0ABV9FN69_9BACL
MSRKRQSVLIGLGLALALAGCADNGARSGVGTQSYKQDGYLGQTNARPGLPGHHMITDYRNDNMTMREAIKNVPGVADSTVTFNGADAYVTLKLEPGLAPREIPTVEQQAATVLRFNYPRYTIHVQSLGPAGGAAAEGESADSAGR